MMLGNLVKSGLMLSVPLAMMLALNVNAATEKQTVSGETILSRLHSANIDEVALGQLAAKRGDAADVKKYGQSLAREHQAADKQLLLLAKNKRVNISTTGKGLTESIRTMKESVAYQNLKTLSGKKFDEEFLKTVKDEHKKMIDVLESASVTDEEVSKFADRQLVALREHLQKAESISKD